MNKSNAVYTNSTFHNNNFTAKTPEKSNIHKSVSDSQDKKNVSESCSGGLYIRRYINGIPATREQLCNNCVISDNRAVSVITSAMDRASAASLRELL